MRDSGLLLSSVHEGLVNAGLDVSAIYARFGWDARNLPLQELRTPHRLQAMFWQTLESVTGDPEIGLHLCEKMPPFRGQVLEYLMFSSPTFGDGAQRAMKYLRLVSDALEISTVEDAKGSRLEVVSTAAEAPQLRHTEICVAHQLIRFGRSVTENHFKPLRVRLRCSRRASQQEFEQVFGCPVEFEAPRSEIWYDPAIRDYRSPHWDPDLLRLHEELAEKKLSGLKRADLIERIRALFSQRLELENCELEDVARELGMPARRLRFELTRAGTSFSQLMSDFRFALARKLLSRTDEPIENIVYLTGFSEPSTFYRAFKRWSGMTPVQYRNRRRAGRVLAQATAG
jgi:AraC-like DNA-binding protein